MLTSSSNATLRRGRHLGRPRFAPKETLSVALTSRRLIAGLALVGLLAVAGKVASPAAAQAGTTHPAHIHNGTCSDLKDVVYPLNDVGAPTMDASGTPVASMPMGAADAIPVEVSVTTVQTTLNNLVSAPYAVNVHESAASIGNYIACGNIGGAVMGSDLAVGLGELNKSGYSGVAWLHDNGDGTTTVSVYLTEAGGTTASSAAASEPVAVTLNDFTVTPAQASFKVGQTYTFEATNDGKAVHEIVIEKAGDVDHALVANGQVAEADDIAPGASKALTWTFTEPGTYQIACHEPGHFEAGMVTTITVTN
jgi:uncharacterized cupredoxin-like copper-binding protein